ncbi:hypothetical protein B4107_3026 [Bacillus safensis]|nr:hypothetical protein B4107_3026 [Bacillus safensis]
MAARLASSGKFVSTLMNKKHPLFKKKYRAKWWIKNPSMMKK